MTSQELESKVKQVVASLEDSKENPIVGGYVPPYIGSGEIKFVIIGQDPTVRNPKSREKITCTLNLDKNGSLRAFVERICKDLNVSMDNLYATNLFKYFYTVPPANTPDVLKRHLQLLKRSVIISKSKIDGNRLRTYICPRYLQNLML